MTHPDPVAPTHRLDHEADRAGELIRYARAVRSGANLEAAAWNRLEQEWSRPRWPLRAALIAAIAAVCMVLVQRSRLSRSNHETAQRRPDVTVDTQPSLAAIPTGWSSLADGSKIQLSESGKAEARTVRPGHTRILLVKGSVELSVTPKSNGELLDVEAGDFLFRVVGTEFQVSLSDSGTHLDVRTGRVAVYEHDAQRALIDAGGSWDSSRVVPRESPEQLPIDVQTRNQPAAKPEQDCLALARGGNHRQALECFNQRSHGSGLDAEVALYEAARLRRDVLGDLNGALSALREYTRRFPNGAFSTEASVTIVELEAARGNAAAALRESAQILESGEARERASEIRLLRGRLRQRRGEYAQAITEYTIVIEQGGSLGLQARVERANCLNADGRRDEAIAEYREIQSRAAGPIAELAKKQLEKLTSSPTHGDGK
jgi:hypothetical protein